MTARSSHPKRRVRSRPGPEAPEVGVRRPGGRGGVPTASVLVITGFAVCDDGTTVPRAQALPPDEAKRLALHTGDSQ